MWAALKALVLQEGTCAPSTREVDERESDNDKEVTKSQLSKPAPCLGGTFWENHNAMERKRSPNLPLPHVSSPKGTPSQDEDRAPRIEAQAWRVRAATPKALAVWEVRALLVYEPGKEICANSSIAGMHCSASASDEEWGQLPGWEMEHALKGGHTTGHGWGGRPDQNWEVWLGAEWDIPLQVERVKILQGENRGRSFRSRNRGPTTADSVFVEAQLEDGSWGLIAGPVPLNAEGWTTIRLCCAGAKRHRASSDQGCVRTPALRVASPNEVVPKLSDKGCANPALASTACEPTSSVKKKKKVSFARNNYSQYSDPNLPPKCKPSAFPSLGL